MCQSHGILQLPRSFLRTIVLPMHLFLSNSTIWRFSKSFLACIITHHMIFFWVLENPSSQLGTFPMPLETNNTYAQASSNQSIPMLVFTRFSKIINELHAHVYWHRINQNKLSSEPNTYLHKYLLLVPQVSDLAYTTMEFTTLPHPIHGCALKGSHISASLRLSANIF